MAEENKTNEEKVEAQAEPAGEGAKKEGKLSGFFKKVGQKFDDATYDSRLTSDFNKNHVKYQVFTGTGVFSANPEIAVEEHLDGERKYVTMLGGDDDVIKAGCLIRKNNDQTVYHITAVEDTTLTIDFEGKTNQKAGKNIYIGEAAEKVNVIKVGDDFYRV